MAQQPAQTDPTKADLQIEVIDRPEDVIEAFDCTCKAFGEQVHDAIWIAMNPEWEKDGPEGRPRAAARLVEQWRGITYDSQGNPNSIYLKATLPDPADSARRVIAGFAIWAQLSIVEGHGDPPSDDLRSSLDLDALYPGNEAEQRYLSQVHRSFAKRRCEFVREKATSQPPSVMHLQLCASDPAYQRRGIASKLVQWGLDEAQRRGGLEAITEASSSKYSSAYSKIPPNHHSLYALVFPVIFVLLCPKAKSCL